MNVIIPFHFGDRGAAIQLVRWIQELGPQPSGKFFLLTRQELQDPAMLPTGWTWMHDWAKLDVKWPPDASGVNSLWQAVAREAKRKASGPWLWLEPDAVPCRRDWLAAIEREYAQCGKPFMGAKSPNEKRLSGVAVYADRTPLLAPLAFNCDPVPFDQAGARNFLEQAHITSLIVDDPKCAPFKDAADFDARVPEGTAIHHGDKSGGIYELLRSRIQRTEGGEKEAATGRVHVAPHVNPEKITAPVKTENPAGTETFSDGLCARLDWIMERATGPNRALLYTELKRRGIEAGRKTRALRKR